MIKATTVGNFIPAIQVGEDLYYQRELVFKTERDALDHAEMTKDILEHSLLTAIRKSHYIKRG